MIKIGKPYLTCQDGKARLNARVEVSRETALRYLKKAETLRNATWVIHLDYPPQAWENGGDVLFFETDEKYAGDLCTERSNAFVTAMFWYACVSGSDICFETPLSERLYRGLTEMLLPKLLPDEKERIKLIGPVTKEPLANKGGVVTGMSGGADSFYTLHCYEKEDAPGGLRLTHLMHCDACYHLPKPEETTDVRRVYEEKRKAAEIIQKRAEIITAHHGLSFVPFYTNMDECYYRGGYIFTGMYRFLSCTLTLEPLFTTYISSSSGHESGMVDLSLYAPTQNYEELIIEACRTENFQYITSDHTSRTEKLKVIADDPDFQKYAEVCFNFAKNHCNCGECYGCWKTMIPLDIIGKLDRFSESFDLEKYYANRRKIFRDLIEFSKRPEAFSARASVRQILQLAEENTGGRFFCVLLQLAEENTEEPSPCVFTVLYI